MSRSARHPSPNERSYVMPPPHLFRARSHFRGPSSHRQDMRRGAPCRVNCEGMLTLPPSRPSEPTFFLLYCWCSSAKNPQTFRIFIIVYHLANDRDLVYRRRKATVKVCVGFSGRVRWQLLDGFKRHFGVEMSVYCRLTVEFQVPTTRWR